MGTGLLTFIWIELIIFCGSGNYLHTIHCIFAMLLYDADFIRLEATFLAYMKTSLPFSIVRWWVGFYVGRSLFLNVVMRVIYYFLKWVF